MQSGGTTAIRSPAPKRGQLSPARRASALLLAAAVPIAAALVAYAVHPRPVGLAEVTWNRLLLQGTIPLLWLTALSWEGAGDLARDA